MSTQNDWEDKLKDYLFLTNLRWAFIHEKMKIGMVTADNKREYLLAIDGLKNLLADARKEVIDRIEKVLCNHNYSSMKSKKIFNVKEEIRDVLAILREEERHG